MLGNLPCYSIFQIRIHRPNLAVCHHENEYFFSLFPQSIYRKHCKCAIVHRRLGCVVFSIVYWWPTWRPHQRKPSCCAPIAEKLCPIRRFSKTIQMFPVPPATFDKHLAKLNAPNGCRPKHAIYVLLCFIENTKLIKQFLITSTIPYAMFSLDCPFGTISSNIKKYLFKTSLLLLPVDSSTNVSVG